MEKKEGLTDRGGGSGKIKTKKVNSDNTHKKEKIEEEEYFKSVKLDRAGYVLKTLISLICLLAASYMVLLFLQAFGLINLSDKILLALSAMVIFIFKLLGKFI